MRKNDYQGGKKGRIQFLKYRENIFQKVKQNLSDRFIEDIFSKSAEENYERNKTVFKHIDKTCSSDLVDSIDYGKK